MELRRFEEDRYYRTTDPELAVFGAPSTLAQWRHAGQGPDFVRFGNRILYRGDALNSFLDSHTVSYTRDGGGDDDTNVDTSGCVPGSSPAFGAATVRPVHRGTATDAGLA